MEKVRSLRAVLLALMFTLLLAACGTSTSEPVPFRSGRFHLGVALPPGWAAAEGPEWLARPFSGLVAFNSWEEPGFWAPAVTKGSSTTYSPASVLGQVPDEGAYVVLIHFSGGPRMLAEQYGPEYEPQDLDGLWKQGDCRAADGAWWVDFYKWGRFLRLEVYCRPDATDATVSALNNLLASWRFDRVPVGDVGWAVVEARQQLPSAAEPAQFPLLAGPPDLPGPLQSTEQRESVVRITQAQVRGNTVVVTFMLRWDEPQQGSTDSDCPPDRCHWWRFKARPSGEVVLLEEGGADLPRETKTGDPISTPSPTGTTTPGITPGTDVVVSCHQVYPGLPGCGVYDEPLVGGRLAFVDPRPGLDSHPIVLDLEGGGHWVLGEHPADLLGWSPSGEHLLIRQGEGEYTVYPHDATWAASFEDTAGPPFWAPASAFADATDWLAVPASEGSLLAIPFPDGEARQVLPPGSLRRNGRAQVLWSDDGWLAWSPGQGTDEPAQILYVRPIDTNVGPTTWTLSQNALRGPYYRLLDWVPGTRLILAAVGPNSASIAADGLQLATIHADTGDITLLDAWMLLTPEAYAWHPARPGILVLAEGSGRYIAENKRLAMLDVTGGELQVFTGVDLAAFEPAWSPNGDLLAYAAGPASPNVLGERGTPDRSLAGRAIYVVDPETGESRRLTDPGQAIDGWPQWSAAPLEGGTDSTRLLYTRQHDGYTDVRVVALDGSSDEILLTGLPDPACYQGGCDWRQMLAYSPGVSTLSAPGTARPRWQQVLFVYNHEGATELWTIDPATGDARQRIRPEQTVQDPALSPSGETIAYVRVTGDYGGIASELWLMDRGGANPRPLYAPPPDQSVLSRPAWQPDGQEIYFLQLGGGADDQLLRIPVSGGEPTVVLTDCLDFALSPDGEWLASVSLDRQLTVSKRDGTQIRDIEPQGARFADYYSLAASAHGDLLAFQGTEQGEDTWNLYVMDWSGRDVRRLTDLNGFHPFTRSSGQVNGLAWTADGAHLVYSVDGHPEQSGIWLIDLDGGERRHLFAWEEGEWAAVQGPWFEPGSPHPD